MKKIKINLDDYTDNPIDDPDNPEWTEEMFRTARPLRENPELLAKLLEASANLRARKARGRPPLEYPKMQVTLRLDEEVVNAFREDGPGWQSRINEELKNVVKRPREQAVMSFVGLDGSSNGWVAVRIERHERRIDFLDRIERLMGTPFQRAAIDIPIGLPDDGSRICDLEARRLLAPHQSRVFLGVRRWILECSSTAHANQEARRRGQKGVAAQLFCLSRKIAEVDALILRVGQEKIMETHPELVFWRLNGNQALPSKKSIEGQAHRRALLEADGFDELDDWLAQRLGKGAKVDDVLDACACAIAARENCHKVPESGARTDNRGLRMEINY
jgi:predicted RNase H-like nuclease/uncharacterized protein (DUF4415 family)